MEINESSRASARWISGQTLRTHSILFNRCSLGVVTGFDLLPFCDSGDVSQPVSAVMHPPVTIQPTASLSEAAATMLQMHIHRLLVLDPTAPDGMPLGLISTADIVVEMASPAPSPRVAA